MGSDMTILRGAPAFTILDGAGKHFDEPNGNSCDYALSQPLLSHDAKSLDGFISHAWSTSRMAKFWTLFIVFRTRAAMFGMLVGCSAAVVLSLRGTLPTMVTAERFADLPGVLTPVSIWCQLLGFVGSVIGIFVQHAAERLSAQPTLFFFGA